MSSFDGQNTDRENSKPSPVSKARDNDLKTSSRGSIQSIAKESNSGQNTITGSGADAVTASIK